MEIGIKRSERVISFEKFKYPFAPHHPECCWRALIFCSGAFIYLELMSMEILLEGWQQVNKKYRVVFFKCFCVTLRMGI
jgi:hypothetical protein